MMNTYSFKYDIIDTTPNHNSGDGMQTVSLEKYKKHLCGEYTRYKTIKSYYQSAKQLLKITNNTINEETLQQYQHYINHHYDKNNSKRIRLYGANRFLRWLSYDYIFKMPSQENTNQRTLTENQIDTLLDISKYIPETHLIIRLLWDGCLRPNKIIDLKLNDKNDNKLYLDQTKTGDKHVIMSKPLITAWEQYLEIRPIPTPEYQQYLLIDTWQNYRGQKFHNNHYIVKTIKNLGKTIGTTYPITPYTIRRTSATLRQNKFSKYFAGDPKLVQRMFNHSDIRTTMRYNQITDNDVEKYLNELYIHSDKAYISPQNLNKTICVEDEDTNCASFSTSIFSSVFGVGVAA